MIRLFLAFILALQAANHPSKNSYKIAAAKKSLRYNIQPSLSPLQSCLSTEVSRMVLHC